MNHRLRWVDTLRGAAVAAVFTIHATAMFLDDVPFAAYLNAMSRWSVPLLIMLAGFVARIRRREGESTVAFVRRKARRLIAPYVIWSCVAAGVLLIQYWPSLKDATLRAATGFATGTSWYHLWFIGTLFACAVLERALRSRLTERVLTQVGLFALVVAVASIALLRAAGSDVVVLYQPLISWVYGSPAYWFFAYMLGIQAAGGMQPSRVKPSTLLLAGGVLLVLDGLLLATVSSFALRGGIEVVGGYLVAMGSMLTLRGDSGSWARRQFSWLGVRSMGIYCMHPFVLLVVSRIAHRVSPASPSAAMMLTLVVGGLATVLGVGMLDRIPVARAAVR